MENFKSNEKCVLLRKFCFHVDISQETSMFDKVSGFAPSLSFVSPLFLTLTYSGLTYQLHSHQAVITGPGVPDFALLKYTHTRGMHSRCPTHGFSFHASVVISPTDSLCSFSFPRPGLHVKFIAGVALILFIYFPKYLRSFIITWGAFIVTFSIIWKIKKKSKRKCFKVNMLFLNLSELFCSLSTTDLP